MKGKIEKKFTEFGIALDDEWHKGYLMFRRNKVAKRLPERMHVNTAVSARQAAEYMGIGHIKLYELMEELNIKRVPGKQTILAPHEYNALAFRRAKIFWSERARWLLRYFEKPGQKLRREKVEEEARVNKTFDLIWKSLEK